MNRRNLSFLWTAALIAGPLQAQPAPSMTAHFMDVGQGHATLL